MSKRWDPAKWCRSYQTPEQQYCLSHCLLWCAGSAELCCCGERLYQSVLQEREAGEELPLQPAGRQQKPGQLPVHSTHAQTGSLAALRIYACAYLDRVLESQSNPFSGFRIRISDPVLFDPESGIRKRFFPDLGSRILDPKPIFLIT